MKNYSSYKGRLIILNHEYPIYDDNDVVIGYTDKNDMAVITFEGSGHELEGYFEMILVSGQYIGIDTLALKKKDIDNSIFVFNRIDDEETVNIKDQEIKIKKLG